MNGSQDTLLDTDWTGIKEKGGGSLRVSRPKESNLSHPNICALILRDQFYKFEKLGNVEREQSGTGHIRPHSVHTLSTPYNFLSIHVRQRYLVLANEVAVMMEDRVIDNKHSNYRPIEYIAK